MGFATLFSAKRSEEEKRVALEFVNMMEFIDD
jgi:hypothetical protein